MRGRRGRPPKTPSLPPADTSPGPTAGLRSRLRGVSSRGRWALHGDASPPARGRRRRRKAAPSSRGRRGRGGRAPSKVVYDDHESDDERRDLEDFPEEAADDIDDDDYRHDLDDEIDDDDASYCTDSSFRSHSTYSSSTPAKTSLNRRHTHRFSDVSRKSSD
ncbi:unnamed protein product [Ranitomeya imitator]|uniref:Uncharacterized protein n=1 Tax=Ranitomeya imitator TaxID=111125 RepID=A0ABN9M169_9NEOB|nr:unnamed protein product [Ranitomeya imitator]